MAAFQEKLEDKYETLALSIKLEKLVVDEEETENCKTPTAEQHRIPVITTCPPAPKKRKDSPFNSKANNSPDDKSRKVNSLQIVDN